MTMAERTELLEAAAAKDERVAFWMNQARNEKANITRIWPHTISPLFAWTPYPHTTSKLNARCCHIAAMNFRRAAAVDG